MTLVVIRFDGGVSVGADMQQTSGGGGSTAVSHRSARRLVDLSDTVVVGRTAAAVATEAQLVAGGVHDAAWHRYGTALSVARVAHYLRRAIYNNNNNGAGTGLLVVGYCRASVHS